ncbi:MAG: hypothetical protein Kow00109_11690 [Acidobacteriota bacterium]
MESGGNRKALRYLWLVLAALTEVASLPLADTPAIRIPEEVEVQGDRLVLGELAVVPDELQALEIGYAPYPGHHRWLRRAEVERALRRAGRLQFHLVMPEQVLVRRARQLLDGERVREAVLGYLRAAWPHFAIELEEIQLPRDVSLPVGTLELAIPQAERPTRLEHLTLPLELDVEGKTAGRQWVTVRAAAIGPVVVAARSLDFGQRLAKADVVVQPRRLYDLEGVITDPTEAVGAALAQAVPEGEVLRRSALRTPVLVRRGEIVTLVARGSGFAVSVMAKSRDAGGRGDWIEVENLESRQTVTARVVAPGRVEVGLQEVRR